MERYSIFTGRKSYNVKISVLPNLNYRFKAISIKIPASYFVDIDKLILKFLGKGKRHRIANTILKEKTIVEILTPLDITTYYKFRAIKTMWYWWKNRRIEQRNRIQHPEIDKYSQLIFDKGTKAVFLTNDAETTRYPHAKKKKSRHRPYILQKN